MNCRRVFGVVCALGLGGIQLGCGGGSTGGSADMAMAGVGADLAVPGCTTDNMPVVLAKRYGVRASLNVNVKVPGDCVGDGCVFNKDTTASLLLLADMTQTGATAMVSARPCTIEIPKVSLKGQPMPTVLTAPDALVQSVKAVASTAALSGPNTCAGFTSMPLAIVLGARLANGASDPLPTFKTANNPHVTLCGGTADTACDTAMDSGCVCDQEADKKAGATVNASGLPALDDVDQVYLALRTVVSLNGMVYPPAANQPNPGQRIKGSVAGLKLDQSPVGCRHNPGGGGAPFDCDDATTGMVATLNPLVTQSTNTASTFVAMPVPDGESCAQLITDAPALFAGQ